MKNNTNENISISPALLDAIRSFPMERKVCHCGEEFVSSPFEIYAVCPVCQTKIKIRSFSALAEIEDVFDAVFEWMMRPGAQALIEGRQKILREDL